MRVATITTGLMIAIATITSAQTPSSDEQQIRDLIAKYDAGQRTGMATKDSIFWSGAFKRPMIGAEQGEPLQGGKPLSDRASTRTKTTPVRIEVSKSGDLAYEFSNAELTVEMKDGQKSSGPTSVLRVWKKESGQWKIAATFARPHAP